MRFIIARIGDNETIAFAASEVQRLIKEMDGSVSVELRKYKAKDQTVKNAVWIGVDGSVERSNDDRIFIDVKNADGVISGSNERAVLIAAYRFMYELGCRFLRPGKDGEKVPKRALAPENINVCVNEAASYRHRAMCIEGSVSSEHVYNMIDWMPKVGMSGYFTQFFSPSEFFKRYYKRYYENPENRDFGNELTNDDVDRIMDSLMDDIKKRGLDYHAVGHGWTCAPFGLDASGWYKYEGEPDEEIRSILAQTDGKRQFRYGIPLNTNLCYSNDTVREKMVNSIVDYCKTHEEVTYLHFWLADGSNNHCECANCQAKTPADYYVLMLNDLDEKLEKEGIDTKIVCLIYNDLMWTPETEKIKNPDRFVLMFAPISRTYSVSYADIDMNEKVELTPYVRNKNVRIKSVAEAVARLKKWQTEQKCGDSFLFDYHLMWDHHYDPGYYEVAKILQKDMASLDKIGTNGMVSCQLLRTALPTALPMYAMAQTLWNKNKTFEEIAKEYFTAAFGEDADVVENYMATLSELFDPVLLRGDKPFENEEMIKQYGKAKQVIDDFKNTYIVKMADTSKDWEYLSYHAEMAKLYADAYIYYFAGNEEESKAQIQKLRDYVDETSTYTDTVLDDEFLKGDLYNNIFGWRKRF